MCLSACQQALITVDEFSTCEYSKGKKVFSGSADEFRVDGYVGHADAWPNFDQSLQTGLKITPTGIEIRTGGVRTRTGNLGASETDYLDMRKKINVDLTDGVAGAANAWDLKITFDEPKATTTPGGNTNWFGGGDYYWRAIVDPHDDQLDSTKTDFYVADTFTQAASDKDLGTYEVWLPNHVDLNKGLEPDADAGVVRCRNGDLSSATGNSCPDDDQNYYLDYAAYGLFIYTADPNALASSTGSTAVDTVRGSRIQGMYFGYSAFDDSDNKRTKDIGTAIERGTFRGRTIARAFTGTTTPSATNAINRFLRGDVSLTVNIGKGDSSTANIKGELTSFEEWNRASGVWVAYPEAFKVYMNTDGTPDGAAAAIGADGKFEGVAKFAAQVGPAVGSLPALNPTLTTGGPAGGQIYGGAATGAAGVFEGNFYGDRSTNANLEVAGSRGMGPRTETSAGANTGYLYNIIGSFGAKQRPAPPATAPSEN